MEKLNFDSGIKEYQMNGGVLRFNPSDPNVYARFMESVDKIKALEEKLVADAKAQITPENEDLSGEVVLRLMAKADREAKKLLSWVFGAENDFDKLLCGVNLLAVGSNGERVITNLFAALTPIITEGAESCAKLQADKAVAQANLNRAQRRAVSRKKGKK